MYKKIVGIFIIGLFFGTCFLPIISGDIEVNRNVNYEDNVDIVSFLPPDQLDQEQPLWNGGGESTGDNYLIAQSFVPSLDTLTRVGLYCYNVFHAVAPRYLIISIRKSLDGNTLTSKSVDLQSLPTDFSGWLDFDFPDIRVTTGETYYIIWETTNHIDDRKVDWLHYWLETGDPYPFGKKWLYDAQQDNWWNYDDTIPVPGRIDCTFRTYGYDYENQAEPSISSLTGSLGVSATIFNNINESLYNINWSIDVEPSIGLILSGSHTANIIDEMLAGGSDTIQSSGLRGIGLITITVQVADAVKQATAFLLGPLVLRVNEG